MPSVPKFGDRACLVGGIKVYRQLDVHHIGHTVCHIAVAAEIKINLQRITDHDHQSAEGIQLRNVVIAYRYYLGQRICNQYFFGKSQGKSIQSAA